MLTAKVLISLDLMSLPALITLLEIKVDRAGCRDITGFDTVASVTHTFTKMLYYFQKTSYPPAKITFHISY